MFWYPTQSDPFPTAAAPPFVQPVGSAGVAIWPTMFETADFYPDTAVESIAVTVQLRMRFWRELDICIAKADPETGFIYTGVVLQGAFNSSFFVVRDAGVTITSGGGDPAPEQMPAGGPGGEYGAGVYSPNGRTRYLWSTFSPWTSDHIGGGFGGILGRLANGVWTVFVSIEGGDATLQVLSPTALAVNGVPLEQL